jgi:hypothetical protein
MSVINEVCSKTGHKIQTVVVKQVIDPVVKIAINVYDTYCSQCGNDLKQCVNYAPRPTRRKDNVDSSRSSKSGSKEGRNSEDRNESRVGAKSGVPEPEVSRDSAPTGRDGQPSNGPA